MWRVSQKNHILWELSFLFLKRRFFHNQALSISTALCPAFEQKLENSYKSGAIAMTVWLTEWIKNTPPYIGTHLCLHNKQNPLSLLNSLKYHTIFNKWKAKNFEVNLGVSLPEKYLNLLGVSCHMQILLSCIREVSSHLSNILVSVHWNVYLQSIVL